VSALFPCGKRTKKQQITHFACLRKQVRTDIKGARKRMGHVVGCLVARTHSEVAALAAGDGFA
jgi:hypothetical protein